MGRLAEATARTKLQSDLNFERAQIGRSTIDQNVYSRMQGAGLLQNGEIVGAQNEAIANQIRLNEQLKLSRDLTADFATGFASDLLRGASAADAARNALARLLDQIINMSIKNLVGAAFGGGNGGSPIGSLFNALLGSGGGGGGGGGNPVGNLIGQLLGALFGGTTGTGGLFANGGAFLNGNVIPFARGGIVHGPTIFPMAKGMGLMGEAGPEAVMPLRRTSDGRLGIAATGNGGGGRGNVVNNTYNYASDRVQTETRQNNQGGTDTIIKMREDLKREIKSEMIADAYDGGGMYKAIRERRGR